MRKGIFQVAGIHAHRKSFLDSAACFLQKAAEDLQLMAQVVNFARRAVDCRDEPSQLDYTIKNLAGKGQEASSRGSDAQRVRHNAIGDAGLRRVVRLMTW